MIGSLGGASRGISFGHRFPRLPQRRVSKPPSKSAVNLPLALDLRRPPCTGRQQPRRSRPVPNLEGARSQPPGRRARRPPARSEQARRSPETGCALTGLLAVPCGKKLARPTPRVSRGVRTPNYTGNAVNRRQTTCLAMSRRRGCCVCVFGLRTQASFRDQGGQMIKVPKKAPRTTTAATHMPIIYRVLSLSRFAMSASRFAMSTRSRSMALSCIA